MGAISFEYENHKNFVCVTEQCRANQNEYQMKMIEKNHIPGLLSLQIRLINNQIHFYYDITAKQQMSKLYEYTKLQWTDLEMICRSLSILSNALERYMLDLDCIMLNPETIFVDLAEQTLFFLYSPELPEYGGFDKALRELFEYILEHYDHNTERDKLMRVYAIYQRIVQKQYRVSQLQEMLQEGQPNKMETSKNKKSSNDKNGITENAEALQIQADEPIVVDSVPCEELIDEEEVYDNRLISIKKGITAVAIVLTVFGLVCLLFPQGIPFNLPGWLAMLLVVIGAVVYSFMQYIPKSAFTKIVQKKFMQPFVVQAGEVHAEKEFAKESCSSSNWTVDKENAATEDDVPCNNVYDKHTVLLKEYLNQQKEIEVQMKLVGQTKNECILVNHFPFAIGSMESKCDYFIENALISRIHLCILKVDDIFYVEDMNSTNGSYLNGIKLSMGKRQKVKTGDELKLAVLTYMVEIT